MLDPAPQILECSKYVLKAPHILNLVSILIPTQEELGLVNQMTWFSDHTDLLKLLHDVC